MTIGNSLSLVVRACQCQCGMTFRVLQTSTQHYAISTHNPFYRREIVRRMSDDEVVKSRQEPYDIVVNEKDDDIIKGI